MTDSHLQNKSLPQPNKGNNPDHNSNSCAETKDPNLQTPPKHQTKQISHQTSEQILNQQLQRIKQKINTEMKSALIIQRQKIQKNKGSIQNDNKTHECKVCNCSGTTECSKKIQFLEGKIREYLNFPYRKQISQIYDIEKLGLNNQSYLVQFTDNSIQKLNIKYIKRNYLGNYVNFLEKQCFKEN